MKNAIKIFTIIALVMLIGFTMIACNKGGGGSSGGGSEGGGKLIGTFEYEGTTRTFTGNKCVFQSGDYTSETTFTISGDEITFTKADGDVTKLKYTLSGKTLTLDGGAGVQEWAKQ